MNSWLQNIGRLLVVVLLQVLLINNLHFLGLCNPCIYILFLFALPATLPRWTELLIGFALGLLMDMFCNSLGVHTIACTAIAYLRPILLANLLQDNDRITGSVCGMSIGMINYVKIVVILTLLHHTLLFTMAAFSFHNWWLTLLQILISSAVSIGIILLYDLFKTR